MERGLASGVQGRLRFARPTFSSLLQSAPSLQGVEITVSRPQLNAGSVGIERGFFASFQDQAKFRHLGRRGLREITGYSE